MAIYRLKRKTFGVVDMLTGKTDTKSELLTSLDNASKPSPIPASKPAPAVPAAPKISTPLTAKGTASAAGKTLEATKTAYKNGLAVGSSKVGFRQGAMNSWNRMGTMGKVGVGAGLAVGAGLMAKGLFGGKKKED